MEYIFSNKRTVIAIVLALMATAWSTQSSAQTPTTLGVGISTPVCTLHLIELQKQVDELKNLKQ